jgi:hypothetical protein
MSRYDLESFAQPGREPTRQYPPPSLEECRRFAQAYETAAPGPNGLFQLAQITAAGQPPKWPYRMCEERDCAQLQTRTASEIGELTGTVIDAANYDLRGNAGETTASYRAVAAFPLTNEGRRLLTVGRREERKASPSIATADSVLREALAILDRHRLDHRNKPLLSLEQEVADPSLRRLLVRRRIPYALRLDPDYPFRNVHRPLDPDNDVLEHIAVEYLFDYFKPGRDRTRPSYLEVSDLREGAEVRSRKMREHLFEFPVDGCLEHFVVWPGLSSAARSEDRLRSSHELAARAASLLLDRPSDELRMREFHHPHAARYANALHLAAFGRAHLP